MFVVDYMVGVWGIDISCYLFKFMGFLVLSKVVRRKVDFIYYYMINLVLGIIF